MNYKNALFFAHENNMACYNVLARNDCFDDALTEARNYIDPVSGLSEMRCEIQHLINAG
jgi:hypothetical protein